MTNNYIVCQNCGEENPLFFSKCGKCHHYLRATIPNIDFWSTVWKIFEYPVDGLKNVIYAEHKNFISFLTFFVSVKFLLISAFIQSFFDDGVVKSGSFIYNLLLQSLIYSIFLIVFSALVNLVIKSVSKSKFKNTFSVILYSFIPLALTLFFLTPIEYGIFGKHWFIFNPSPFLIKTIPAYILTIIEGIFIVWSLFIFWKGVKLLSDSTLLTTALTLIFIISLGSIIYFVPYIII
ncbi:MAG: hypothetical protein HYS24_07490 [Ignavibacteriales bacterium]|nr:hypothetical protein [Ignavibacteriales bacterium]